MYSSLPVSPSQPSLSGQSLEKTEVDHRDRIPILLPATESQIYLFCVEQVQSVEDSAAHLHSKISGVPPV